MTTTPSTRTLASLTDQECYGAMIVAFGSCERLGHINRPTGCLSLWAVSSEWGDKNCLDIYPDGMISAYREGFEQTSPRPFNAVGLVRYFGELGVGFEL